MLFYYSVLYSYILLPQRHVPSVVNHTLMNITSARTINRDIQIRCKTAIGMAKMMKEPEPKVIIHYTMGLDEERAKRLGSISI